MTAKPFWTVEQIVNQLTHSSSSSNPWTDVELGVPRELTFSFPTEAPAEDAAEPDIETFQSFNADQKAAARLALEAFGDVIEVKFTETSGSTGDIRFMNVNHSSPTGDYVAKAAGPGPGRGGDVFVNLFPHDGHNVLHPTRSEHGFSTFMHEIAHAMGIGHAGNYDGGNPTYADDALFAQDTEQYTVMSYFQRQDSNNGSDHTYYEDQTQQFAETLALYDIAALQEYYGANPHTRTGATTYGFHSNTGSTSPYNFAHNIDPVICIYDAGGKDTLDFSGFTEKTRLDLAQGAFSNTARMAQNVSIAFGTVIENGVGGSASDVIRGNSVANVLRANGGNDTVSGYNGTDTLVGGNGNDLLAGGLGKDVLQGDGGRDAYLFNAALGTSNIDTIKNFVAAGDTIRLDDAIFTKLGTWGSSKFYASNSGTAHDSSDRIVYEADTGKLSYDADGNKAGAAIQFAVLTGHPTLGWADFIVV